MAFYMNNRTSFPRWVLLLSGALVIVGLLLVVFSRSLTSAFARDLLLGLGLALAPSGIIGILADWLIFGQLIDALGTTTISLGDKTESLQDEITSLRYSTDFLRRSSELGLEMIYVDRSDALRDFRSLLVVEANRKSREPAGRIVIVGSSIKGLLENVQDASRIVRHAIENRCKLNILLTHPEYSPFRENQEDSPEGSIADQIFDGIRILEREVEPKYPDLPSSTLSSLVRLYKGTPTCFMIVAGSRMLINPYPYEDVAYKNFCIAVKQVEERDTAVGAQKTIFHQYMMAHFDKPWDRNSLPYLHYSLEGPDPREAWDRDSCYGDVFVIQDADHFYLAVYLEGQRKMEIRGMPTSIPCKDPSGDHDYLRMPERFSIRLLDTESQSWISLDDRLKHLTLQPTRRRGKVTGEVEGNINNDYSMLGLFDPKGEIQNPHKHMEDTRFESMRDQPLPLFYVSLQRDLVNVRRTLDSEAQQAAIGTKRLD